MHPWALRIGGLGEFVFCISDEDDGMDLVEKYFPLELEGKVLRFLVSD